MANALYYDILLGVKAAVDALQLTVPVDSVNPCQARIQKLPWVKSPQVGIVISPTRELIEMATNGEDDIAYGVQVTVIQPSNSNLTDNLNELLTIRETLIKAFQPTATQPPLATVASVFNVTIESGPIFDPTAFQYQFDIQALLLRFTSRRARGL